MLGNVNTIYRIEHPSTGEGMYSNWGMHKYGTDLYEKHEALRNRLNRDNDEFTLPPGKEIARMFGYVYLSELEYDDNISLEAKSVIDKYSSFRYKDSTKYACTSLECLSQWIYSELNLNELIELGFKLVSYDVPSVDCLELKHQILYNENRVCRKLTLPMKCLLRHLLPIREENKFSIEEEVTKLINKTDKFDRNIKVTIQPMNYVNKWVGNVKDAILNAFDTPKPPRIKGCILEKVLNP